MSLTSYKYENLEIGYENWIFLKHSPGWLNFEFTRAFILGRFLLLESLSLQVIIQK